MAAESPTDGPPLEAIESVFAVTEIHRSADKLVYVGQPRVSPAAVTQELWPTFHDAGYELELRGARGRTALVAEPQSLGVDGIPWKHIGLFVATVLSTLFAGTFWYHIDPFAEPAALLQAWPFSAAILFVLGVHEMGHYVASRYHRVQASLPYFIPIPTLIGTLGAVIKMNGRMPSRKALFDIGVAGPLAGLVATIGVTTVGLHMEPIHAPAAVVQSPDAVQLHLGFPLLLEGLAALFGQPLYRGDPTTMVNPVVIGGWVGMFVTLLNLIPVGQLDGGHILRAMIGPDQETVGALVPAALLGLAGYLYFLTDHTGQAASVWILWAVLTTLLAIAGPAKPFVEERLDSRRRVLGALTFGLGALCFTPVPIEIVG
ncbi:putative membrane-associated Zn-dependent protease [Halovivax ruber XH-70]|uniref:Putative membrane-associated Zn-dependent protease n=1 Tax=Halovivax ruber (strain DSM 18193 / JCM 13892 / XH-70) TaxID=797302 RepID=L0I7K8_HALRX|nr:site-2 protease family protein [Halovivax ruber]AGB14768.1 putative membrane-associated Zn-dependent protease [Halovivax ruber XH-70]